MDKFPGVWPNGVVEVYHIMMGKAVMVIGKLDIIESVARCQFCVGLKGGCKATVHFVIKVFKNNEASLFVDAINTFNSLNHITTLINLPSV